MTDVDDRIAQLEAQLAELKASVAAERSGEATSRRAMFKTIALGVAGVAGAGAVGSLLDAAPAAAANNDAIKIGATTTGTAQTVAFYTGSVTDSAFVFVSGSSIPFSGNATLLAVATAEGANDIAITGITNAANSVAVVGEAFGARGIGLAALGTEAALLLVPSTGNAGLAKAAHRAGEVIGTAPIVPAGATAALVTVTATAPVNSGFLAVYSADVSPPPSTSSLNFTGGQDIATTTVSVVDPSAAVKVFVGPGASTHVLIDVLGYYQ